MQRGTAIRRLPIVEQREVAAEALPDDLSCASITTAAPGVGLVCAGGGVPWGCCVVELTGPARNARPHGEGDGEGPSQETSPAQRMESRRISSRLRQYGSSTPRAGLKVRFSG